MILTPERGHPCPQWTRSVRKIFALKLRHSSEGFSRSRAHCGQGCPRSD